MGATYEGQLIYSSGEGENSKLVTEPVENCTVYAHLKRKDIYNYWEKEEKTIYKEYVENYKKADPL